MSGIDRHIGRSSDEILAASSRPRSTSSSGTPREYLVRNAEGEVSAVVVRGEPSSAKAAVAQAALVSAQCLPTDSADRKAIPLARGCLDYFPAALAAVAMLSKAGNDKHNPGQELHHARGKSMDHADCILRHLVDRGQIDPEDGILHDVKVAWRALALLQEELERRGAPKARGAK